jgi:hypothetical protein
VLDEAAQLAREVTPFAVSVLGGYGAAVVEGAQSRGADATVSFVGRLLRRLTGRDSEHPASGPSAEQAAVAQAVEEWCADSGDPDVEAALRVQIARAFRADPELAAEVRSWTWPPAPEGPGSAVTHGSRSPATGINTGVIITGDLQGRPSSGGRDDGGREEGSR